MSIKNHILIIAVHNVLSSARYNTNVNVVEDDIKPEIKIEFKRYGHDFNMATTAILNKSPIDKKQDKYRMKHHSRLNKSLRK